MKDLLDRMVTTIDLLESRKPDGISWKKIFDEIMVETVTVNASIESQGENSNNALFRILVKQNNILVALMMLVLISGSRSQK